MNGLENPSLGRSDRTRGWLLATGLGLVVVLLAPSLSGADRVGRGISFYLLSLPPLLLALPGWLEAARQWVSRTPSRWLVAAYLVLALVPERLARGSLRDLVGPALYAGAALLLTADRPGGPRALIRDVPLVLALWLPMELRWIEGNFVLLRLFGLDLLVMLFVLERSIWSPGRLVPVRRSELLWSTAPYLVFLLLAIPFAMVTGFASPGLAERTAGGWVLFLVGTYWVTALPEEALFRGVIQGLLARVLPGHLIPLLLAAVIFGLSHLNNHNGDPPDWRYVVLASVAGVAYGLAYLRTRNIAAPTLAHFLVDVTWRGFFVG